MLVITLSVSVYLSLRFDNEHNEFIISKTDGLYRVYKVLPYYLKEYTGADIISSAVSALIFTLPFRFIPEGFFTNTNVLTEFLEVLHTAFVSFGLLGFYLAFLGITLAAHILPIPLAMMHWRAVWLSSFATANGEGL